jgi:NADH-quinone oxidoreductase subunit C
MALAADCTADLTAQNSARRHDPVNCRRVRRNFMDHITKSIEALREAFGEAVQDVVEFRDQTTAQIAREAVVDVLRFLKETPELDYNWLATLTALDDWPEEPRFAVLYQLYSMRFGAYLRLKVRVAGDDPTLPTATGVFLNANWHERELYDMFGLTFTGHPDLRRVLMPADWAGHPLRKDYPLGYEEVQFSFNWKEIDEKKPYAKE